MFFGNYGLFSDNIKVPVTTKTPQKYKDNNKINSIQWKSINFIGKFTGRSPDTCIALKSSGRSRPSVKGGGGGGKASLRPQFGLKKRGHGGPSPGSTTQK